MAHLRQASPSVLESRDAWHLHQVLPLLIGYVPSRNHISTQSLWGACRVCWVHLGTKEKACGPLPG